jgi:hypothetical protein
MSPSTSRVNATDRKKISITSTDVGEEPDVARRHRTSDAVRTQVANATTASGTPNPGAIVNTPRTTQTSVINIISEASEKPPAGSLAAICLTRVASARPSQPRLLVTSTGVLHSQQIVALLGSFAPQLEQLNSADEGSRVFFATSIELKIPSSRMRWHR